MICGKAGVTVVAALTLAVALLLVAGAAMPECPTAPALWDAAVLRELAVVVLGLMLRPEPKGARGQCTTPACKNKPHPPSELLKLSVHFAEVVSERVRKSILTGTKNADSRLSLRCFTRLCVIL